jgi:hypothetical protein
LFALAFIAAPVAAASLASIDDWAGVYRVAHKTARGGVTLVDAEDILEIVKVTPTSAFFRTRLIEQNEHICALHGVADLKGGELIYRARKDALTGDEPPCEFHIRSFGGDLEFRDARSCSDFCGVGSSFEGVRFPAKAKRPIRYMARLLSSREYAEAMREHRQGR